MNTQANEVVFPAPAPKVKGARKAAKAVTAPATTKGPVIKLTDKKPDYKDGSARALWFGAVQKANGKPVDEFVEAATKKPPVLTKAGNGEAPMGWLRYFAKAGLIQLSE